MNDQTLWLAQLETTNFEFLAIDCSKANAQFALRQGLAEHAKQYSLVADWWNSYIDSAIYTEVAAGTCLRDREVLYKQVMLSKDVNKDVLLLALRIEESRLLLLGAGGEMFYGSTACNEMGNEVVTLCARNGLDLLDDGGYCDKATAEEVCEYNIARIQKALEA